MKKVLHPKYVLYNIGFLGHQSLGFYAEILILAKTSNFSSPYPLILMPIVKSQNDSFTNKQTNNIFQVSHFQKFPTIMDVYGWQYEKKSLF